MTEVIRGSRLTAHLERHCDVCIVGSGPGGSTLAAELSARGLSVVVLEEGPAVDKRDFDQTERTAFRALYQDQGARATKDLAINILQGRCIGGGGTINWTTCFRAPSRTLDIWAHQFGVEGMDTYSLARHFDAVEQRLAISVWPESLANTNNRTLQRGATELGWSVAPLRRNVRGCANLGSCGMGCPVDAKQGMHLTYLRDALAHGATVIADTRVQRLARKRQHVVSVHGEAIDQATRQPTGRQVIIRPKIVVSSAGAINGPGLLLRSGLDFNGRVGRRTFLHPSLVMLGIFDEPVAAHAGAPQAFGSHEFADRGPDHIGFFLETAPVHPMLASSAPRSFGRDYHDVMAQFNHLSAVIALNIDGVHAHDEGGTVRLRWGKHPVLHYPIRTAMKEAFRAAHVALARVTLAGGARMVRSTHTDAIICRDPSDLAQFDNARYGAHHHYIGSAHQMGGCSMGHDKARHVVGSNFRHHHVDNLFVVDGSVFPTALGVNPFETICALGLAAADHVANAV